MKRGCITTVQFATCKYSVQYFVCSNFQESKEDMADTTQNMSYQAGEAKGQAQEKASGTMDKAGNVAQSTKESCQQAGQQVMDKAQGAAESVKNAVGMNK